MRGGRRDCVDAYRDAMRIGRGDRSSHVVRFVVLLLMVSFAVAAAVRAEQSETPRVLEEQKGNIRNLKVEGSLAPTRELPCIAIEEALPTYTPPDLHTAVGKCVSAGQFDRAARLFMLAGAFLAFDSQRIA